MKSPHERHRFFWRLRVLFLIGLVVIALSCYWLDVPLSIGCLPIVGYVAFSVLFGLSIRRIFSTKAQG